MSLDVAEYDYLPEIEAALLAADSDEIIDIPSLAPDFEQEQFEQEQTAPNPAAPVILPAPSDLMSREAFRKQFILVHELAGSMIQMRTGKPCPLGEQAGSEGGIAAADAAYDLAMSNPAMQQMFLSIKSTFWGQVIALGMHGFSCLQIFKVSQSAPPVEMELELEA